MRMAICDDEEKDIEVIEKYIIENMPDDINIIIEKFINGNMFLSRCSEESFNVVFLDMALYDISGIDVARKISRLYPNMDIVFVTNRDDLVFESIQYQPVWYVRKSMISEEMQRAINKLIIKFRDANDCIEIIQNGVKRKLQCSKIVYIESYGHYLHFMLEDETIKIRGKILDYSQKLCSSGFVRCHRCFIINIRFISKINYNKVVLATGVQTPISRQNYHLIYEKYEEWVRERYYG